MVGWHILASVFGPGAVRTGGTLLTSYDARGSIRGMSVKVDLHWSNTRRSTKQFTTIDIEEDIDVVVYTGGAHWPFPEWEAFSRFQPGPLAEKAAAGAPRALLARITHGPIADRLAAFDFIRLHAGSQAKRDGCATRGVRIDVAGWPTDERSLLFMIDTALMIAVEARREVAAVGFRGGRHPEVAADDVARAASRATGLKVVAGVLAGLSAVSAIIVALMIAVMR